MNDSRLAPPTMGDHEDEARRQAAYGDSPIEETERAAREEALQLLLDGLEVESLHELRRLVDHGRMLDAMIAVGGEDVRLVYDQTRLL